MTAAEPFISLRNVRKVYRSKGAEFLAVSDVTMDVQEGELISLVGPSGCGKTTVLKILAGLHDADGGTVKIGSARTPFDLRDKGVNTRAYFKGGLLGHWSVWTASAIKQFEMCKAARGKETVPADLLALDARVTDCNSAFFDVANDFHGCIAGCHEILRRQGLMQGLWCLDPAEGLSPGQMAEIDRVCREHADLSDDAFVQANLQKWLA